LRATLHKADKRGTSCGRGGTPWLRCVTMEMTPSTSLIIASPPAKVCSESPTVFKRRNASQQNLARRMGNQMATIMAMTTTMMMIDDGHHHHRHLHLRRRRRSSHHHPHTHPRSQHLHQHDYRHGPRQDCYQHEHTTVSMMTTIRWPLRYSC
jgi:hypothetical protein